MLSRHACLASSLRLISSKPLRHLPEHSLIALRYYHDLLVSTSPGQSNHDLANNAPYSDLGLRSQRPPDSLPDPRQETPPEVPDQEWEIRTGRAIFVLQETLPDFFASGLITSIDKTTGSLLPSPSTSNPSANTNFLEHENIDESIYSPSIRLSYTPPVALPTPFPKKLHIEGFQLYLASATFVRHTMNAIYSDLRLNITKMVVNTPKGQLLPPELENRGYSTKKRRINREKSIRIRQVVNGVSRVSGNPAEWETESTYTFSPITGLIQEHVVNSIHPAPHQAVYDSLRLSLGKVLGLGWNGGAGSSSPNGAACKGKIQGGKS